MLLQIYTYISDIYIYIYIYIFKYTIYILYICYIYTNIHTYIYIYIYIYKCKQYVGQSTGDFRFRWNNYKCNDRKYTRNEDCFQEHLFRHFHSGEHTGFLENVKITLIDKTDGQNPKKREDYWRRTLKTYALFGLNVEDSV